MHYPSRLAQLCLVFLAIVPDTVVLVLAEPATAEKRKTLIVPGTVNGRRWQQREAILPVDTTVIEEEAVAEAATTSPKTDAKKLRVCVLVEPSPLTYVSGYANRYKALFKHLSSCQDDVQVVTAELVHKEPPKSWLNFPVHYTKAVRLPHYPLMSISTDWTLKAGRVIARMRPDLIHASSPGFFVMGGLLWSRLFQVPVVFTYHTHIPVYVRSYVKNKFLARCAERLTWLMIRMVHSFADLTLVTSSQIQKEFQDHNVACQVWQKGVDTQRFHPDYKNSAMRHRMMDGHPQDFLIVYIGRLGAEKRLKELKPILERIPNARLCLVGSGPHEDELKEHFKGTNTVFTGHMHGDELSQAFASGDAFCMPSDSETLGFVVLESMASGVPVVAARAGGIPDIIQHDGVTSYLVETGNIDAYVDKLLLLQRNPKLRLEMGRKARAEMERWSWEASMDRLREEQYETARQNFHRRFEQRLWRLLTFRKLPKAEDS